jgi:hypothetical protein
LKYSQQEFAGQLNSCAAECADYTPYVEHVRSSMKRNMTARAASFCPCNQRESLDGSHQSRSPLAKAEEFAGRCHPGSGAALSLSAKVGRRSVETAPWCQSQGSRNCPTYMTVSAKPDWRRDARERGVVIGPKTYRLLSDKPRGRRPDPFRGHWDEMVQCLEEQPDQTALELLIEFQARYPTTRVKSTQSSCRQRIPRHACLVRRTDRIAGWRQWRENRARYWLFPRNLNASYSPTNLPLAAVDCIRQWNSDSAATLCAVRSGHLGNDASSGRRLLSKHSWCLSSSMTRQRLTLGSAVVPIAAVQGRG